MWKATLPTPTMKSDQYNSLNLNSSCLCNNPYSPCKHIIREESVFHISATWLVTTKLSSHQSIVEVKCSNICVKRVTDLFGMDRWTIGIYGIVQGCRSITHQLPLSDFWILWANPNDCCKVLRFGGTWLPGCDDLGFTRGRSNWPSPQNCQGINRYELHCTTKYSPRHCI